MRYEIFFIFFLSLLGCKKYPNDNFLSTYSPGSRLAIGDSCVWTCTKYISANGAASIVPNFHFTLSFDKYSGSLSNSGPEGYANFCHLGDLYLANKDKKYTEITNTQEWSLIEKKEYLNFYGNREILKLSMNQLELKDSIGNIYYFEKKRFEPLASFDSRILNIPMFGIFPELCSIVDYNSCESGGISTNVTLSPINGILGNGIGTEQYNTNASFSFGRYFSKQGYITFWIHTHYCAPKIKLNGQLITDYQSEYCTKPNDEFGTWWSQIKVKINSPGNQIINITNEGVTPTSSNCGILGIDEIRYWEIQ